MKPVHKILVAEDNPALSAVLRFNLQNAGYEVTVARNGKEAFNAAGRSIFDVVITDQQMPLMTGVELIEQLRKIDVYRVTPIILLTAKAMELDKQYFTDQLGIAQLIPKPFSPIAVLETVEQLLTVAS